MRKNNLLALCILFFLTAHAQTNFSWFPVHPNTHYNYKLDTVAGPVSAVIKTDSISTQAPFAAYLNKIVTNCDTCHNALLENDVYDSTYVLDRQPQFLNHSFYKTQASGFYFRGPHSFLICPFVTVGASWLYDTTQNISATLIAKQLQPVLGISDSVCVIKLSTNDTIVLSKNSGIVQFPFKTIAHHNYKLVGVEGPVNAGVKLKSFHDFFDFQAGDVLQYEFSDTDYDILPPKFVAGHERWEILSSVVFNDSVRCHIRLIHLDSLKYGGSPAVVTAYTSTVDLTFTDSIQHPANAYPMQEVMVNPYFIYNNGIKHIHKMLVGVDSTQRVTKKFGQVCPNIYLSPGITGPAAETGFSTVFLNRNSKKVVGLQLTEGLGISSQLYNDYDRVYENCLIGYVKNSHSTGTVYTDNPVGIKQNTLKQPVVLYPIPANEQVTISGSLKPGTQLRIINATGGVVLKTEATLNSTQTINTAALANGLYFIEISYQQFSETKKLVIHH